MHGIILRNAMTLQLSVRLFRWSVPVKNAQTSPLTDCICRYFLALLAVIFHPSFLILFFFVSGRDIPWTTSPTSLCHQIYQKHFQYNNYNNRNHVHSPHIYSYFQRASPQGLAKHSEGTMISYVMQRYFSIPFCLCILCTAFLQKLYCACVSHGLA